MKCRICDSRVYDNIPDTDIVKHFSDFHREELEELSSYKVFIEQIKLYYCDGV